MLVALAKLDHPKKHLVVLVIRAILTLNPMEQATFLKACDEGIDADTLMQISNPLHAGATHGSPGFAALYPVRSATTYAETRESLWVAVGQSITHSESSITDLQTRIERLRLRQLPDFPQAEKMQQYAMVT